MEFYPHWHDFEYSSVTKMQSKPLFENINFKTSHFRVTLGQLILKRACSGRTDIKMFVSYLPEEKVEELANDIFNFVTDCVNNIDDSDEGRATTNHLGAKHKIIF